jgi:hypothetical protein
MHYMITRGSATRFATNETLDAVCQSLAGVPGDLKVVPLDTDEATTVDHRLALDAVESAILAPEMTQETPEAPAEETEPATERAPSEPTTGARENSTWTHQVVDEAGKARVEALHAGLAAAGIDVDASQQAYATGTRMANEGYATQAGRRAEYDQMRPLAEVRDAFLAEVESEHREDVECSAGELARGLSVSGRHVTVNGKRLGEQAIRGLCSRLESPALSYVLGLRDRIVSRLGEPASREANEADLATIADVILHECSQAPDTKLKLRARNHDRNDIFAVVSPGYAPMDPVDVLPAIVSALPDDLRGSYTYDPATTAWEFCAQIFTAVEVADQVVGEPFTGYASFRSRDNGTSRLRGGGGVEMLRCLNASVYSAGAMTTRIHRGRTSIDLDRVVNAAIKAIKTLSDLWGVARTEIVEVPARVTIEEAIPGFYRHLLTDRRSALAGVLPGRVEANVSALSRAYASERRDQDRVTAADLGQGWTRMIQGQNHLVRGEAEIAIGDWLARHAPVSYLAAEV